MFRYPCSYLIQSNAFASLPSELKDSIQTRILAILNAETPVKGFEHLTPDDRTAIREILSETVFRE